MQVVSSLDVTSLLRLTPFEPLDSTWGVPSRLVAWVSYGFLMLLVPSVCDSSLVHRETSTFEPRLKGVA